MSSFTNLSTGSVQFEHVTKRELTRRGQAVTDVGVGAAVLVGCSGLEDGYGQRLVFSHLTEHEQENNLNTKRCGECLRHVMQWHSEQTDDDDDDDSVCG